MTDRVFNRRSTAASWSSVNPILGPAEIAIETDTGLMKVGNGVDPWNSLAYFGPSPFNPSPTVDSSTMTTDKSYTGAAFADLHTLNFTLATDSYCELRARFTVQSWAAATGARYAKFRFLIDGSPVGSEYKNVTSIIHWFERDFDIKHHLELSAASYELKIQWSGIDGVSQLYCSPATYPAETRALLEVKSWPLP